jgi:HEAT repeat protein
VQYRVLDSLARLGPDAAEAIPVLLQWHRQHQSFDRKVVETLANIGPAALPALIDLYRPGKDKPDGPSLDTWLAKMGKSALPQCIDYLQDRDWEIRHRALEALSGLGPDAAEAVPALVRALRDNVDINCLSAIVALREIGPAAAPAVPALVDLLSEKVWREYVIIALGQIGSEGFPVLARLCHAEDDKVRAQAVKAIGQVGPEARPILLAALKDPVAEVRRAAARSLEESDLPLDDSVPPLLQALNDPDSETRDHGFRALGSIKPLPREALLPQAKMLLHDGPTNLNAFLRLRHMGPAASPLLPHLLEMVKDPTSNNRFMALHLIGSIGIPDRDVVNSLCRILRDTGDPDRAQAVNVLARLGPEVRQVVNPSSDQLRCDLVEDALRCCLRDRSPLTRIRAISALWRLGCCTAAEASQRLVVEMLDLPGLFRNGDKEVSEHAAKELAEMGPAAAPIVPALTLALWDPRGGVRCRAAYVLASIGTAGPRAVSGLRRILLQDRLASARIIVLLLKLGEEGQAVLREAPHEHPHFCRDMCSGLSQAGPAARCLLPEITRLLSSEDEQLPLMAAYAICKIAGLTPEARAAQERILVEGGTEQRRTVCQTLGELRSAARPAIPALCEALLDEDDDIRQQVVLALGQIGPDTRVALPALIETLTDPASEIRRLVAETLGTMGRAARPGVPALRTACQDRDPAVRLASAVALARISGQKEEAIAVLECMPPSAPGSVRVQAALVLSELAPRGSVVPDLVRLLEDPPTRSPAADALSKLHSQRTDVIAFVRPLLRHPRRSVRASAHNILTEMKYPPASSSIASR